MVNSIKLSCDKKTEYLGWVQYLHIKTQLEINTKMEDILLSSQKQSNKNYPENPTSRNSVSRFLYENFNYFIDEISMSGSNMLAK